MQSHFLHRQTLFFGDDAAGDRRSSPSSSGYAGARRGFQAASSRRSITQRPVKSAPKPWDKRETPRNLIRAEADGLKNAIIFCNRKVEVAELFRSLVKYDFQRAQAHADFRNGVLDAVRLARRLRQAEAQARSPVSMMQPDAAQQRAQLRADLTALVGEAEVARVLADAGYRPWWLEG